jgi:hypothetical protein
MDKKIYYFAFGANLSMDVLRQRSIKIFDQFDYVLEKAVLKFSQGGFYKDHGYASAEASDVDVVYGKMYLILESDAQRMDYFEGVPYLHAHHKMFSQTEKFQFYFYRSTESIEGLKPTQEYLDYICNAYQLMECVPDDYLKSLKDTEVLDQFDVAEETGTFVSDINQWPKLLHPWLIWYEGFCLRTVEYIWNLSLIQWAIRF